MTNRDVALRQKRHPTGGVVQAKAEVGIRLLAVELPYQRGDRFRVQRDAIVPALTHRRAPMTDGFDATLPAGLVVVALKDAPEDWRTYPGLPAVPEDYEFWESRLVPAADVARKGQYHGYDGFHLSFDVSDLGHLLEPLPGKAAELPFDW